MCKIETKTIFINMETTYAALCTPHGVTYCGATPKNSPPRISKKKVRKVKKVLPFVHAPYYEEGVTLQTSSLRIPYRITRDQEDLRIHRNMTTETHYGPHGEKREHVIAHHSHGKHGKKPFLQKHVRISLRTLANDL